MPQVSVILPTYNRAHLIKRPIKSVLNQQFSDLELIIVDDGSRDDTATVVNEFADSRISYIEHETNKGSSAARNTGINAATGEYIAFLDSDDEWHPTKLSKQIRYLDNLPEEWVAVYCDTQVVRQGQCADLRRVLNKIVPGGKANRIQPEGGEELIPRLLAIEFDPAGGSTLVVESDTINELNGFDESFRRHTDWEFLIRLLRIGKLAAVDEPLVYIYETSYPSIQAHSTAKKSLFEKFNNEIVEAETKGYDVTSAHRFDLALYHILNGDIVGGIKRLSGSDINLRVLMWAVLIGACKKVG